MVELDAEFFENQCVLTKQLALKRLENKPTGFWSQRITPSTSGLASEVKILN
jgi:hypothetical protein